MISAVVLAAGQSRRMGQPKMNLPWGCTTVLGQVVSTLLEAGLEEIVVVTGSQPISECNELTSPSVRCVPNPRAESGEMLSSVQVGVRSLPSECQAALIALGDQPQMEAQVVRLILKTYAETRAVILIPSIHRRRGHPWLVGRSLWNEILSLRAPLSMRDFLNQHTAHIHYLPVDAESVLQDLDTLQDYERFRPKQV